LPGTPSRHCSPVSFQLHLSYIPVSFLSHFSFFLISFLVSGLTGLFFAFAIDQNRHLPNYLTGLWLHVEFGIVMATIAIFHALWHLPYFRGIFPTKPKK